MNIDRRRFFALTAAIAAHTASCTSPPPPVVNVPTEDTTPAKNGDPTPAAATSAPQPSTTASASATPPSDAPAPSRGGALAAGDSDDANFDPSKVHAQKCAGGAADNLKGSPGSCAALKPPGPSCESFSDTKQQCDATKSWLKPRVAEKAVQCHLAKTGTTNVCKFNLVTECFIESLASACVDPAAQATCKNVMNRCGAPKDRYTKLTEDSCVAAVSAVNDTYRSKFVSCITEFCRFETCAYHLTTSFGGPTNETKGGLKVRK